jgi:DNA-binding SARP family transcriptional activator/tetratricopeptide (TPR) repeat protein
MEGPMIRLRTLGTLDLRGPDGAELRSVLAQPKRLAFLAYLAVASPSGFHRRDTLVAMFWPELDHEHARAALRKALHGLRHDLGEGIVVTRGDEDVALAAEGLWCDAAAFERLLSEGRRAEALELYRGDLLTGLYISGAPEFERWLERERARFREQAAAAFWALAQEAETRGDDGAALGTARQALLLSPDDEGAVRRMIAVLDRVGDRAGALRVYEEFAHQLAADYETEPSAETQGLIEEVRRRVRRISGDRPARPRAAPPPVAAAPPSRVPGRRRLLRGLVLVVAAVIAASWGARRLFPSNSVPVLAVGGIQDFTGAAGGAVARALPQLLATNLARLPAIQVISGARLYEIQGQLDGDDPRRDHAVTSAAARRAGASELLEGELYRRQGGGLRLDLRRVRLADGQVIGSYTSEAEDPFSLVDEITSEVALAAGLPPSALHVADVTTPSLTAYQLYEAGLWAYYREGDRPAAHRLFHAALAEDSTFAMAAYYAAICNRWGGAEYQADWLRAARLANRASDRERLLILGTWGVAWQGIDPVATAETLATRYPTEPDGDLLVGDGLIWLRGDYPAAIRHLRRVVTMDSLALSAHGARCLACDALELLNQVYALADSPAARVRISRAWVQLQPRSARARSTLATTYADLGRYEEARAAFDTLLQVRDARAEDTVFWATVEIRVGDFEKADLGLRELLRIGDEDLQAEARWFLAWSLRDQGRDHEAIAVARALHRSDPPHWEYQAQEAMALLELGRPRQAAALFDSLARTRTHSFSPAVVARLRAWLLTHAATALAAAHDTAALAVVADSIDALAPRVGAARDRYYPSYARGLLLAAQGHRSEAAAMLRAALRSPTLGYTPVNLELGKLALQAGRARDAIDILQPPLRGGGFVETAIYSTHTELHLQLGRAFEAAAQPDSAATHYRWVLKAWKNADPEFRPRRDSVQARLVALGRS